MQTIALIGGIITLLAHLPLFRDVYKKKITLNLATWLMWALADSLSLITSIYAGAKLPFLVIAFTTASIIIVILLLKNGTWHWGHKETFAALVSVLCIIIWKFSGPLPALVAIVLGKYIAGLPSLIDAYRRPEKSQALPWLLFAVGSAANIFAAGTWTIAYSFYPTIGLFFNGVMGALHIRKK